MLKKGNNMNISKKLPLDSLVNTRDLGGIKTKDGKEIKKNLIFRSGKLNKCSDIDIKNLYENHNLRTIIDFRTEHENGQSPDRLYKDMVRIANPILTETQMGITREEKEAKRPSNLIFVKRILSQEGRCGLEFMKGLYLNFIENDFCTAQYANFIRLLISENNGSILYHCSVGKDRVGTGTIILLSLLGVEQKDILQDFVLTNEYIEPEIQKEIKELSKNIEDPRLEETYRDLFSVRIAYGEALIDYISSNFGSFDNYRKVVLKITDEEVELLKNKYLV
jgi:protein-tyrosine phosphatase